MNCKDGHQVELSIPCSILCDRSSRHDVDDSKAACRTKVSVAGQRRFPCIQGSDNACYKISADEEDCPADGKHVRSQPVSSDIDETKEGWGYVESLNVLSSLHRERFCPSKTMRSGGASKSIWSFMPSDSAPNALSLEKLDNDASL
jgi:hypothetical protein